MLKYTLLLITVMLLTLETTRADQGNRFQIGDATTVDEAVELIGLELERQGVEIISTINHAAAAASVDLELRPTTVIFVKHKFFDLSLLLRSQISGLDLPLKFLVFEDEEGKIQLEFNDEGFLLDRHRIPQHDQLLRQLDSFLNQFERLDNGVLRVASNQSVDDTVASLFVILEERGFRIPIQGGINFNESTRKPNRKLGMTRLIVFGNPDVGTPLMQNDQSIGLDLPQKFLVYEDRDGQVFIAFNDPSFLAHKHNLQREVDPILDTRLQNITNALMEIAEAAVNP